MPRSSKRTKPAGGMVARMWNVCLVLAAQLVEEIAHHHCRLLSATPQGVCHVRCGNDTYDCDGLDVVTPYTCAPVARAGRPQRL